MQKTHIISERIYGLDLLRVLLSICVVTIHILHYGGFRSHADSSTLGFYFLWLWGIIIDCTVNCFAIITGFLLYIRGFKYTNIIRLYLIVLYHGLLITLAFQQFYPEFVTKSHWLQAMFPISQNEFWYFTAYSGVFFFAPILTSGMRSLSKKQATALVFSLVIIFSILPTLTNRDPFGLDRGYSVLWILVMFLIGTYLGKYYDTFRLKSSTLVSIFLGCILFTCLGMIASVLNPSVNGNVLIEYTSPTIVLAAISVVLLFSSMKVSHRVQRIAVFCLPFTFSTYLIHEHPLIRQYLIYDRFVSVLSLPAVVQVISVLIISLIIWGFCFFLDYVRYSLFRFFKIDDMLLRMERQLAVMNKNAS